MLRLFAERGGDPDRAGKRQRAGPDAVARRSARASPPGPARAAPPGGPAGTSSAPRSRWTPSAWASTCRAAAATWSSRTTSTPPCTPRRSPAAAGPFARALRARGDDRPRRREDEQVPGQPGVRLAAARRRASTRWRSGWRCSSGHYRTDRAWTADLLTDRRGAAGHLAPRRRAAGRRARAAAARSGCASGSPTTWTAPARSPASTSGPRATLAPADGGPDAEDERPGAGRATSSTPCSAWRWLGREPGGRARSGSPTGPARERAEEHARAGRRPVHGQPRPRPPRARGPAAHRVRARPRPGAARQGVPPAQAQDAGVPAPRRRPLRHPAHPHAAGHPGGPLAGPRRWASTRRSPRRSRWATTSATRRSGTSARRRWSPTSPAAGTTPPRACGSSRCSSSST